jgi:hypothetical protein
MGIAIVEGKKSLTGAKAWRGKNEKNSPDNM